MSDRLAPTIARLGLPPPREAAIAALWPLLPEARLVGGAVRDMLAGRPIADLDLATPERPDAVARRLAGHGIKVVPTGIAHGTVTAVVGGLPFEITTLRRDVETDGRHAVVAFTDDWRADASRRDFTINAMFLDAGGVLHDPFAGAADLASRRVRFVGRAARRIEEDHLRILRFFRFHGRFGDPAAPDLEAVAAITAGRASLLGLSAERVWSELRRLLAEGDPGPPVALMEETGVLAVLFGADATPWRLARLLRTDAPPDAVLRLAALTREAPERLAARLRLSGHDAARLAAAAAGPAPQPSLDPDGLRRLLADRTPEALLDAAYLAEVSGTAVPGAAARETEGAWRALRARLLATVPPVFPLAGRDAVALGLAPGPVVGAALGQVRAWWLAGGAVADREACLAALSRLLATGSAAADR